MFWGEEPLDIFTRVKTSQNQVHKVLIIENNNLHDRFLASVLRPSKDDPLASALSSLEKQDCDLVVFIAPLNRKREAALARALLVLDIKNIYAPKNFTVSDYFGIFCVR